MTYRPYPAPPSGPPAPGPQPFARDLSIPTQFRVALHASMAADYFRIEALHTSSRREKALLVRSAALEERLADEAWKRFTAPPPAKAVPIPARVYRCRRARAA